MFVEKQQRGCGIGTALVSAGMNLAQEQGFEKVYATTVGARGILERLGWELVQMVSHSDEKLGLYRCNLGKRDPKAL